MALPREKLWPEDIPEPREFEGKLCKPTGYTCYVYFRGRWQKEFQSEDGDIYLDD